MTLYKERPFRLEAVPVEKVLAGKSLPAWVNDALSDGRVSKLPDGGIAVLTTVGKRRGADGDMLVRNMVGELSVETVARFNALYEKAGA